MQKLWWFRGVGSVRGHGGGLANAAVHRGVTTTGPGRRQTKPPCRHSGPGTTGAQPHLRTFKNKKHHDTDTGVRSEKRRSESERVLHFSSKPSVSSSLWEFLGVCVWGLQSGAFLKSFLKRGVYFFLKKKTTLKQKVG